MENSVKIIDTDNMPWPLPFNDRGWKSKVLFDNPETGDRLMIIWVPIGAPGGINHYHDFHDIHSQKCEMHAHTRAHTHTNVTRTNRQ